MHFKRSNRTDLPTNEQVEDQTKKKERKLPADGLKSYVCFYKEIATQLLDFAYLGCWYACYLNKAKAIGSENQEREM